MKAPIKKNKLIDLSVYRGHTRIKDLKDIRNRIRENIGDELFTIIDFKTLQYHALLQLSLVSKKVKNDIKSINEAIDKVTQYLGLPKNRIKVRNINDNKYNETKEDTEDPHQQFNYWILGFDKTPHSQLEYLKAYVLCHLESIQSLTSMYEQESIIKSYKEKNKMPSNNEERLVFDFYKRCLIERDLILNYFFNGMKARAIQKANTKLGINFFTFDHFYDFPYKGWQEYSEELFDYRKINEYKHRIHDVEVNEESIGKHYLTQKEKFYRELFKLKPVEKMFENIFFYDQHIPFKNKRQGIFEELKKLFQRKRWLAFFALALPQVEGLFTEMLHSINPDSSGKALTDKVEKIRPASFLSESYFDYFQYIVPRVRNKFMHTGFEDNIMLKSYDLLTDIEHLLYVYYELDNPFVKINRLIKKADIMDFSSYKQFAGFFDLIKKIHSKQKNEIESILKNFIDSFLLKECQPEYITQLCIEREFTLRQELIVLIEKYTDSSNIAMLFVENKDLKKAINDNYEKLKNLATYNIEKLEELEIITQYYHGVVSYFKKWNDTTKETFLKIMKDNTPLHKNLLLLKEPISKKEF